MSHKISNEANGISVSTIVVGMLSGRKSKALSSNIFLKDLAYINQ